VVPGISSAIAIPEEAGIPVTHRGVSQSVHIITAHTADTADGLPENLEKIAGLDGTLVFLMGLSRLELLTQRLLECGMKPETPAAVVSGGNTPNPGVVRGTLANLADRARRMQPPAVIVVGPAAALEVTKTVRKPLSGIRVALTGTDAVTVKLRKLLQKQGADICLAGRSRVERLDVDLRDLLERRERWLVFTSRNGVRLFFEELTRSKIDLRNLGDCHFAAIGRGTASALDERGIYADLCPESFTTAALAEALLAAVPDGAEIWLLRSAEGAQALFTQLAARYSVREVPLYKLHSDEESVQRAFGQLKDIDYLAFSSSSGVRFYINEHGTVPEGTACVCIGPVTEQTLRKQYTGRVITADEATVQGIVEKIVRDVEENLNVRENLQ
jgi:uroporphyrinogen III methyltransferase/synthase